jgi:hypothetical protein
MNALFLALQDSETRRWAPVGRLTKDAKGYQFVYTKGVNELSNFSPFSRMTDLSRAYVAPDLFPIFNNRLLPKSRPEYRDYLSWLGLTEESHTALEELERTAGVRATDNFELIPMPAPSAAGRYEAYVFVRGVSHLPTASQERANSLSVGDQLFAMADLQNPHDGTALLLRTGDPISVIGYVPKFYSHDLSEIITKSSPSEVKITVERVNPQAPAQYRVLCKISAAWPEGFVPCSIGAFEPYVEYL